MLTAEQKRKVEQENEKIDRNLHHVRHRIAVEDHHIGHWPLEIGRQLGDLTVPIHIGLPTQEVELVCGLRCDWRCHRDSEQEQRTVFDEGMHVRLSVARPADLVALTISHAAFQ